MLGTAQANALGAEITGRLGVARGIGVGSDAHGTVIVRPLHDGFKIAADLGGQGGQLLAVHAAGIAVQRDPIAALEDTALLGTEKAFLFIDENIVAARHTAAAHAAAYHGGVAGHPASGGKDALGLVHALDILRRSLCAHKDAGLAVGGRLFHFPGREIYLPGGCARRSGQADRHRRRLL